MDSVKGNGGVSAASADSNHMVVAAWRTGGHLAYRMWQGGSWNTIRDLGDPGFSQTQPPASAGTALGTMTFFGVNQRSLLKRNDAAPKAIARAGPSAMILWPGVSTSV